MSHGDIADRGGFGLVALSGAFIDNQRACLVERQAKARFSAPRRALVRASAIIVPWAVIAMVGYGVSEVLLNAL